MTGITPRLRTLPISDSVRLLLREHSDADQILTRGGVPDQFIGHRFRLDREATLFATPRGERIVRFGSSGLSDAVGIDLDSGQVVEVIDVPSSPLLFVNSSLAHFVQSVIAVAARFPYYDTDADDDEIDAVADELTAIVERIDPPAVLPDRYWSTFVDDVTMGDMTTEAILEVNNPE